MAGAPGPDFICRKSSSLGGRLTRGISTSGGTSVTGVLLATTKTLAVTRKAKRERAKKQRGHEPAHGMTDSCLQNGAEWKSGTSVWTPELPKSYKKNFRKKLTGWRRFGLEAIAPSRGENLWALVRREMPSWSASQVLPYLARPGS